MQLYVSDYLGATRALTAEQHGAYLLLLMSMWNAEGDLPNDPKTLARLACCTPSRWAKICGPVLEKFDVEGDRLTNARLRLELKKAQEKSIKRADAGTRGGNAKALKNKEPALAIATGLPCHSSEPEPEKKNDLKVIVGGADPLPVQRAFDQWNETARRVGLPLAKSLTPVRRKHIRARLASDGLEGWMEALVAVEASPLCRGDNDRGWRADLDFVCQAKSFTKLREGSYGAAPTQLGQPPPDPAAVAAALAEQQASRRALLEAAQ